MSIPVLQKIYPFTTIKDHIVYFNVIGTSSQVVYNELQINLNSNNTEVYLQRINEFRYQHTIPKNTLINGEKYYATLRIYDLNQNLLGESERVFFYCFSEPILNIPTIANNKVNAQIVTFVGEYSQAENELLQSYKFLLYDSNKILIAQSPNVYDDDDISYEFGDLTNDGLYHIELKILTINELEYSTGLVQFTANYIVPQLDSVLELNNLSEEASISVKCNIVRIVGISETQPLYIDSEMIDLTNNIAYFPKGFNIMGDFTIQMWVKDIAENEPFFILKANDNSFIELRYINNKIHLYKYLNPNYILQHVIADDSINPAGEEKLFLLPFIMAQIIDETNNGLIFICIKQIDNLYDIYTENLI